MKKYIIIGLIIILILVSGCDLSSLDGSSIDVHSVELKKDVDKVIITVTLINNGGESTKIFDIETSVIMSNGIRYEVSRGDDKISGTCGIVCTIYSTEKKNTVFIFKDLKWIGDENPILYFQFFDVDINDYEIIKIPLKKYL